MRLLAGFLFAASCFAQSTLATFVGTDGTTCKIVKEPSATIWAVWVCYSADQKALTKTAQIISTSTVASADTFSQQAFPSNGVNVGPTCMIGVNPTAAVVSMGSLPPVPVNGIGWSCTSDSHAIVNGTAVWP